MYARLPLLRISVALAASAMGGACGDSDAATEPQVDTPDTTGALTFPATAGPDTVGLDTPTGVFSTTVDPDGSSGSSESGEPEQSDPETMVCGDGLKQGSEECDDAVANDNHAACTAACMTAKCGDGYWQAVNDEQCDLGDLNEPLPGYGQCSRTCKLGPHCGDGVLQPEFEECDPVGDPIGGATCKADCSFWRRVIFMSSTDYKGDLGGLNIADDRCDELAGTVPDLTGVFKAWLLVDTQDLHDRLSEYPDFGATVHFVTVDSLPLAGSLKSLIEDGPQNRITTETKVPMFDKPVWTNITADGLAGDGDCSGWKGTGENGLVGNSGYENPAKHTQWLLDRAWTAGPKRACVLSAHIYCIQVDD